MKLVKLEDICLKITDGAHKTPTYVEEGIPFLRVTDIHTKEINWDKVKRIPKLEHDDLCKRCKPERGDLLYSKNGTIGIAKEITWDEEFSVFVSLALIKTKKELVDSKYLCFFLNSKIALNQATMHTKKGTVSNLHLVEIKKIKIPLPPLSEQKRIATILDEADRQTV